MVPVNEIAAAAAHGPLAGAGGGSLSARIPTRHGGGSSSDSAQRLADSGGYDVEGGSGTTSGAVISGVSPHLAAKLL